MIVRTTIIDDDDSVLETFEHSLPKEDNGEHIDVILESVEESLHAAIAIARWKDLEKLTPIELKEKTITLDDLKKELDNEK